MRESLIVPFSNLLNDETCEKLITLFEKKADTSTHHTLDNQYNYCEINMYNDIDFNEHCKSIATLCMNAVDYYRKNACSFLLDTIPYFETITTFETPVIRKYSKGEGFINWHFDSATFDSSRRFLAITIMLNDVPCGGELEFKTPETAFNIHAKAGTLVISPTSFEYLHRENFANNDKYVIMTFALLPDTQKYITD